MIITDQRLVMMGLRNCAKTPLQFHIQYKPLNSDTTVEERIFSLLKHCRISNTVVNGHFQCREMANRSTQDLWRLYKNYYDRDATIFTVMEALYQLITKKKLSGNFCSNVRKLVFWIDPYPYFGSTSVEESFELHVPLNRWKNIGEENV
jgi:hypothetical protein